ncbi:MAG: serine/threonine-protein kinase, partial [Cyanobacteria bacterium P01_E01_bin.35]
MDNNLVGQTIQGRYYVVKQLGRGGVGVTFLAQDQQCFDSPCVVKQLKPKTSNPKALAIARRLFNREAEIMNRLGHCDRIPRLLAYFEQDNDFFLVQELIEGHDLSQEIIAGQPWTESKTIALVAETLEVLLIVQQYSVIHRDLKPSNLMRRSQDDKIILIDFGSVKQVSTQIIDAAGKVKQTVAVGTKSYMPMEQMMGHPGFYSDIYALGIIAIQALTGVPPKKLTIDDQGEIIWRRRLNSQVNYQPRFLDILDRMIRYRHQERYSAAGVVLADLKQLDVAQNNNKETIIISQSKSTATPQLTQSVSNSNRELLLTKSASTAKNSKNRGRGINGSIKSIKPQNSHNAPKVAKSPLKSRFVLLAGVLGGLILLTAIWGVWFFFKQQSPEPESELLLYENSSQGFKVNYPDV